VTRLLPWMLLVGALAFGSPIGLEPRPGPHDVVDILIDADTHEGRLVPIWDEVNLWKLHMIFGVQHTTEHPRHWLRHALPWARYGRVVAALGGNHTPAIAPACDHGEATDVHPYSGTGECGSDGAPGPAARNELARRVDGQLRVDYAPFRLAVGRLLDSGLLPHLNLSAAPAPFTAPATDFAHYHWNAAPIRDLAGWRTFVAGAFRAVDDLDPAGWRISIVNEANCLTLVGWEQHLEHVGYAGSPAHYARTFAETAAVVRAAAPRARLHAGNYVTSATFPGEDNLSEYLVALRAALDDTSGIGWDNLDAISLSLYETPDTMVYEFPSVRLARARAALTTAGLAPLPFKIDELGLHPTIGTAFETRFGTQIDASLWAASWHAEALHTLIAVGDVVSVSPWLSRLLGVAADGRRRPYPTARVYELFGTLAGQLRPVDDADGLRFEETGTDTGVPRLRVIGSQPCPPDAPRLHPERAMSLSALASETAEGVRALIVHHRNRPSSDRDQARRRHARRIQIRVTGLDPGAYRVRRLAVGGRGGIAWADGSPIAPRWHDAGCHVTETGDLALGAEEWIEANTVWLVDAHRALNCAPAAPALGAQD